MTARNGRWVVRWCCDCLYEYRTVVTVIFGLFLVLVGKGCMAWEFWRAVLCVFLESTRFILAKHGMAHGKM